MADQSFASKVAPLIVKREYQPNELVYDCGDKVIVVLIHPARSRAPVGVLSSFAPFRCFRRAADLLRLCFHPTARSSWSVVLRRTKVARCCMLCVVSMHCSPTESSS